MLLQGRAARRIALGLLQVLLSALLIAVALASVDRAALVEVLGRTSVWFLVGSVIAVLGVALIQSVRWRLIVSFLGGELSAPRSAVIVFLSLLYNQVLPSTVGGDAVRVWMARHQAPSVAQIVHSVVVDRVSGLAALALMATIAWPVLLRDVGPSPAVIVAGAVSFGGVLATVLLFLTSFLPDKLAATFLLRWVWGLASALRSSSLPVGRALRIGGMAVLGHVCILSITGLLGFSLGIDTGWSTYAVVIPPVLIVSVLPISVAGWGVRESAMVVGLGLMGVSSEEAFALSILFGAVSTVAGVAGGAIWVVARFLTRGSAGSSPEVGSP